MINVQASCGGDNIQLDIYDDHVVDINTMLGILEDAGCLYKLDISPTTGAVIAIFRDKPIFNQFLHLLVSKYIEIADYIDKLNETLTTN